MQRYENSTKRKYLQDIVIKFTMIAIIPSFFLFSLINTSIWLFLGTLSVLWILFIFILRKLYKGRYKKVPSEFIIRDKNLVLIYNGKKETIDWDNIRDCTPRSPWVIRTLDGKDYDLSVIDEEITRNVYRFWKEKKG